MRGFVDLGYKNGDLPVTEMLANEIFSLPMYPSLSEQAQYQVIEALIDILKKV
jgi:aminotransferase EvaB